MQENGRYHVLSLSPSQRAVLKWLVRHYLDTEIQRQFLKIQDMRVKTLDEFVFTKASKTVSSFIDKYEQMTNGWPLLSEKSTGFQGHKQNLYYLSNLGMRIALDSLALYNDTVASLILGKDDKNLVDSELPRLTDLIMESSKHQFSKAEIETELKRNGG